MKFTFNSSYLLLALLLFIVEVLIGFYTHNWIRAYLGDFLVVILLYCLVKGFFNLKINHALTGVLIFSYLIETLQYFHIVNVLGLQKVTMARIIIGTDFSWIDMLMYTLGICLVAIIEMMRSSKI
jgi:hypothetical protein